MMKKRKLKWYHTGIIIILGILILGELAFLAGRYLF
jgi:hypothetical protein